MTLTRSAAAVPTTGRPERVEWVAPRPFWPGATAERGPQDPLAMRRPELIRFTTDDFMDRLAAVLARDPAGLTALRATPVSYRQHPAGAPPDWVANTRGLKLFQPFHGHFNLVVASLVCRLNGLPDHTVAASKGEEVGFVLRRLQARSGPAVQPAITTQAELAWALSPDGAKRWVPVPAGAEAITAEGEEVFPLFPVIFSQEERVCRLWAGLIPTSSSETFRTTRVEAHELPPKPELGPAPNTADVDPRWSEFDVRIVGPLTDLKAVKSASAGPAADVREIPADVRAEASAFLLLDLADLLRAHLPVVWTAIQTGTAPPSGTGPAADLYRALTGDAGFAWRQHLNAAAAQWAVITGEAPGTGPRPDLHRAQLDPRELQRLFRLALSGAPPTSAPSGTDLPKFDPAGEAEYVVRCVYRRPRCGCPEPISEASAIFTIAPVFDTDAPARTIRIPMPTGTSIKALRRSPKNVGFMLSNELRAQMNRVTDMKKSLDGNIGAEERWDLGVICQFSLPIITIVALLLMIAIVFLLNIVFFWTPFFRICLPIPLRSRGPS